MASVIFDPCSLVFNVQHGSAPQIVLTIRNTCTSRTIAFKMMTTRPLGYLVQPNQGIVNPNSSISIVILLQCDQMLLQDIIKDEFLVQSVDVGAGFFDLSQRGSKQDMDTKFLDLWTQKDRQVLCNHKLPCYFVGGKQEEANPAVTPLPEISIRETPSVRFERAIEDADVHLKWRKRDKLKKLVAQLTYERDKLIDDLSKTQQRLQRAEVEMQWLNEDLEQTVGTSLLWPHQARMLVK
ncbi:hypothetical protein DVH05_007443 [Phytophthora capsici]|nr:hypothetical protein DVH05_005278 [Phytophthora capsici]KAG1703496.1 hypothetical protein DVH05_007443 [Phytophthora capsici]